MALSAFDDNAREPNDVAIADVLLDATDLWHDLEHQIESRFDPLVADWVFSGKKWGWFSNGRIHFR